MKRNIGIKVITAALAAAFALFLTACAAKEPAAPEDVAALAGDAAAQVQVQIDELYDDYAYYYTAEELASRVEGLMGSFGGIGIYMTDMDGHVIIYGIMEDAPVARSGLFAEGDIILAVDGENVENKDSAYVANITRGEPGTQVVLDMRRASDGTQYTATLTREQIKNNTVHGEHLAAAPGIVYIRISGFNIYTAANFVEAYNELAAQQTVSGIILDLRSNGGGEFTSAIGVAEFFVPTNEVVVSEKTRYGKTLYRSKNGQLSSMPVAVLINDYSASSSEVLAGALRDRSNSVLIGSTSYGKGITQSVSELASGNGHSYTRSIYYTPIGFSLHGVGLEPQVVIETDETMTNEAYFSTDPAVNPFIDAALEEIEKLQQK